MIKDIKTRVQGVDPNIRNLDISELREKTGNVYEALAIITQRAKYLNNEIKNELIKKLEEFISSTDIIEEISENREQIEISKFYERLPNAAIIALEEFLKGELYYRYMQEDNE